jgi:hypothetical protein
MLISLGRNRALVHLKQVIGEPTGSGSRRVLVDPQHGCPYQGRVPRQLRRGQPAGEKHPQARLTEDDVRTIRERLAAGDRQADIARDYGIDPSHVAHIRAGRAWQHTGPPVGTTERRGSSRPSSKLTEADIPNIILRIERGSSLTAVARMYGVGRTTIADIWYGRRWKHVPRPTMTGPRKPVYADLYE